MIKRGLYTRVRGDVICLAPPLVTTAEQIDRIVDIVREAIPRMQGLNGGDLSTVRQSCSTYTRGLQLVTIGAH